MEPLKINQNFSELNFTQKTDRNNSKNLLMELIYNTKSNFEIKINNIVSILQNMKKENDENLEKSKCYHI